MSRQYMNGDLDMNGYSILNAGGSSFTGYLTGINVKNYGVVGDGVTDDRAALNTLITSLTAGSSLYFPPGTYLIGSNITFAKELHFWGSLSTIIKTTANTQVFTLTTGGEKSSFRNMKFEGSSAGLSQYGIWFNGSGSFVVDGCYFYNWGRGGILVQDINASNELGGLINACKFFSNNTGVNLLAVGEYVQITNNDFILNTKAIEAAGGNGIINANNLDYNGTGIEISTGANNGKVIISNNTINHNTSFCVNIHDVTSGVYLTNNNMVVGTMRIANTTGVNITGGLINLDAYTFDTNVGLMFMDVRLPGSLANTITLVGNTPYYINCYHLDGRTATDLDNFTTASAPWGTYTPTLTNVANLDASTAYLCQWMRVGNTITVSGKVDIDPTAGGASTQLGISLPVASNLANAQDCAGTAFASGIAGQGAAILGDTVNDRAQMQFISADVTNQPMYFTFTYTVK